MFCTKSFNSIDNINKISYELSKYVDSVQKGLHSIHIPLLSCKDM